MKPWWELPLSEQLKILAVVVISLYVAWRLWSFGDHPFWDKLIGKKGEEVK